MAKMTTSWVNDTVLKFIAPSMKRAPLLKDVPEYEGMKVFDANPLVVERLKKSGHLILLLKSNIVIHIVGEQKHP